MPTLDYSSQLVNPNAKVIVAGLSNPFPASNGSFKSTSTQVAGIMAGTLGFGMTNEWGTPLWSQSQAGLSQTVQGVEASVGNAVQRMGFKGFSNPTTLINANQSVKTWTGSSLPVFNVNLKFIALNESDNVTLAHKALLSSVCPIFSNKSSLSSFIQSPLGYTSTGITANGTISVALGQWFKAISQVMISVDMEYSKETLLSGAPLYCEGKISFTPFRMMSYEEILGYFIG